MKKNLKKIKLKKLSSDNLEQLHKDATKFLAKADVPYIHDPIDNYIKLKANFRLWLSEKKNKNLEFLSKVIYQSKKHLFNK